MVSYKIKHTRQFAQTCLGLSTKKIVLIGNARHYAKRAYEFGRSFKKNLRNLVRIVNLHSKLTPRHSHTTLLFCADYVLEK